MRLPHVYLTTHAIDIFHNGLSLIVSLSFIHHAFQSIDHTVFDTVSATTSVIIAIMAIRTTTCVPVAAKYMPLL